MENMERWQLLKNSARDYKIMVIAAKKLWEETMHGQLLRASNFRKKQLLEDIVTIYRYSKY